MDPEETAVHRAEDQARRVDRLGEDLRRPVGLDHPEDVAEELLDLDVDDALDQLPDLGQAGGVDAEARSEADLVEEEAELAEGDVLEGEDAVAVPLLGVDDPPIR